MENVVANELKICLFLKHPNITQIYGCFYDSQKIYILMEYAGINLHSCILKDSDDVVQNLINIYEAVAYLHCLGILHRDIKPENILCNFVKILLSREFPSYAILDGQFLHKEQVGQHFAGHHFMFLHKF
jgi:serine/threonine protein kinase